MKPLYLHLLAAVAAVAAGAGIVYSAVRSAEWKGRALAVAEQLRRANDSAAVVHAKFVERSMQEADSLRREVERSMAKSLSAQARLAAARDSLRVAESARDSIPALLAVVEELEALTWEQAETIQAQEREVVSLRGVITAQQLHAARLTDEVATLRKLIADMPALQPPRPATSLAPAALAGAAVGVIAGFLLAR